SLAEGGPRRAGAPLDGVPGTPHGRPPMPVELRYPPGPARDRIQRAGPGGRPGARMGSHLRGPPGLEPGKAPRGTPARVLRRAPPVVRRTPGGVLGVGGARARDGLPDRTVAGPRPEVHAGETRMAPGRDDEHRGELLPRGPSPRGDRLRHGVVPGPQDDDPRGAPPSRESGRGRPRRVPR